MPRVLLFAALLLTVSLFVVATACAQDSVDSDKQLAFADELFSEGDYFRAISEYKRFMFFFSDDQRVERAFFHIGESYYKAGKWEDAIATLNQFIERYPDSKFKNSAFYLIGLSEKNLKRYKESLTTFEQVIARDKGSLRDQSLYQTALVHVERHDWQAAIASFNRIPTDSPLAESARTFSSGLSRVGDIPQKSPYVAGALAAVLPGSGHVYTERYRDAGVAFLLNGAFIWAAVELFKKEEYVTGGIVTFFELGWYTGNIYSAITSAYKYNERKKEDFLKELQQRSFLSVTYDHDHGRFVKLSIIF